MLNRLVMKDSLAKIFASLLLFFANSLLVFADTHIIGIAKEVNPKVQTVEGGDTVIWEITNANAHSHDISLRAANTLRITFTGNNPTTEAATRTSSIDPPGTPTTTEIEVELKEDLNDGVYPYTVEILDQFDIVLATIDPALVATSVDENGDLIPSKFDGNCQDVTVSGATVGCIVRGTCIEDLSKPITSITLTNIVVRNVAGGYCDIQIEAETHPFSPRGIKGRLILDGKFSSLDIVPDIVTSTGEPIGSGPIFSVGPLVSNLPGIQPFHGEDPGPLGQWKPLISKHTTTQLRSTLDISLELVPNEAIYLANSDEHAIIDKDLVELISFNATTDEQGNHLSWISGAESDNAGFLLHRATRDRYGNYEVTLLEKFSHFEQVIPELNEDCSVKIQGQLKANNSNRPPKLVPAVGNSVESTCYSFVDTSNLRDGTYYYLLEDIDNNGNSTFHCNHIDTITIAQNSIASSKSTLRSVINHCKKVTGNND